MNSTIERSVQQPVLLQRSINFEDISKKTGLPIAEIEHSTGLFNPPCPGNSIFEVRQTYESSPLGSSERLAAKIWWNKLCCQEVKNARTFSEVHYICNFSPHGSEAEQLALNKMLKLAKSQDELKLIINKCPDIINETRIKAISKLVELHIKK